MGMSWQYGPVQNHVYLLTSITSLDVSQTSISYEPPSCTKKVVRDICDANDAINLNDRHHDISYTKGYRPGPISQNQQSNMILEWEGLL